MRIDGTLITIRLQLPEAFIVDMNVFLAIEGDVL